MKSSKAARLDEYKKILQAIFQEHLGTFLVDRGRYGVTDPLPKVESTGKPESSFAYASGVEFLGTTGLLRAGAVLRQAQEAKSHGHRSA